MHYYYFATQPALYTHHQYIILFINFITILTEIDYLNKQFKNQLLQGID